MHLDQVVLQVLKVQQEHKVVLVLQVLKVLLVTQQQVLRELQVLLEHKVHKVIKVIQELLDRQVFLQGSYYYGKEVLVLYRQVGCFVMEAIIHQI